MSHHSDPMAMLDEPTDATAEALLALHCYVAPSGPEVTTTAKPKTETKGAGVVEQPPSPTKGTKRKRKEKEEEAALHKLPLPGEPWQDICVTLRSGKYKGRRATVLGLAKKKYRVQVHGLEYQLEFYPSCVGLPAPSQDNVPTPRRGNMARPASSAVTPIAIPVAKPIASGTQLDVNLAESTNGSSPTMAAGAVPGGLLPGVAEQRQVGGPSTAALAQVKKCKDNSTNSQSIQQPRNMIPAGSHGLLLKTESGQMMLVRSTSGLGVASTGSSPHCSLVTDGDGTQYVLTPDPVIGDGNAGPAVTTKAVASAASLKVKGESAALFQQDYAHWVGQTLEIRRGKYMGKQAHIVGLTTAKLQVLVDGVPHQLEYYPTMFYQG